MCVGPDLVHHLLVSTRIDNGLRLQGDPFALLATLRPALRAVHEELVQRKVVTQATEVLDRHRLGLPLVPFDVDDSALRRHRSPLRFARHAVTREHKKAQRSAYREPFDDLQCEVTFLPVPGEDFFLFLVYTEQDRYREVVMSLPGVSEFAYSNADDESPPGVSADEYQARGELWESVLLDEAPGRTGLSWSLLGPYVTISSDVDPGYLMALVPSVEERASALAHLTVKSSVSVSDPDFMRELDVYSADLEAEAQRVALRLSPVTFEDLSVLP